MTSRQYKILRNIIVLIGIIGGFVLWTFIPPIIENNWLIHVSAKQYDAKWAMLLLLIIPLFALNEEEISVHADDEVLKNQARDKAARKQMLIAIFCSGCVLTVMTITLLLYG